MSFGLSNFRTIGPSDYRTFGLSDLLTIGPSDYRTVTLSSLSLRGEVCDHKSSLTPYLFIEVPVPRHESERSCIYEFCLFLRFSIGFWNYFRFSFYFLFYHRTGNVNLLLSISRDTIELMTSHF